MERLPTQQTRNVAIVGHGGSGKSSLFEALLSLDAGADRSSRTATATTRSLAVARFEWRNHSLNCIDTPGFPDFLADTVAALRVADLAVVVVDAIDGVQVQTEWCWHRASELGIPRIIFVNKLDRDRASFDACLEHLRECFGAGVAPIELPIGDGAAFRGVLDLLGDTAWVAEDGHSVEHPIPNSLREREHRVHEALVEGIVVADDTLLERYLDGDPIGFDELEAALAIGLDAATVFPVVCGSTAARVGVDRLADLIVEIGPSPIDAPEFTVVAGTETIKVPPDPDGDPLLQVFKTFSDPYVGHVTYARVRSGRLGPDEHLLNPRSGAIERLRGLGLPQATQTISANEVVAGEIVAIPKLSATVTGDCLTPPRKPVRADWPPLLPPGLHVIVRPVSSSDDDRLSAALHRLVEEDGGLSLSQDEDSHELLLGAQGELHLKATAERLLEQFTVHVEFVDRPIPYRETAVAQGEGEGRYKKQSGGHGQFAVALVHLAPLTRGEGFRFVDAVVGGAIPRSFIPAVEHGVTEALAEGGPHGYPVVDVEVTCIDGKHHSVDSSEMSFRMAGRLAVRAALEAAGTVVLEPNSRLLVTVPTHLQGDVIGDINGRRGRVLGTEFGEHDGESTVIAEVPDAELRRYAIELRSLTGGRGAFTRTSMGYEPLPQTTAAPERPRR